MGQTLPLPTEPPRGVLLRTRRGRLTLFFLLYLAEGLPLGLSIYALTAYFRMRGAPVSEIGLFMGAIIAPWGLKWLWAPLIDLIRPRRFGPNRSWIVFTQAMMAVTLAFLFVLDPQRDLALLSVLMVVHNAFAATQDVAIDGFAVRILPDSEMAWANGLMFAGQKLGMAIGGGGSLYVASLYGFKASFALVLGALLCILLGVSVRIREDPEEEPLFATRKGSWLTRLGARLGLFFGNLYVGFFRSGTGPRVGVLYSILPAGAMALAYGIASALQVDLGFSEQQISASTTVTLLASAAGCAMAGALADRLGAKRLLALTHALTAIPTVYLGYAITAGGLGSISYPEYLGAAVFYNAAVGVLFGVVGGVCMELTNPAVGATQFTGYMSLRNIVIAYAGYWQGLAATSVGYGTTLWIDALVGLLPIALIPLLRPSGVRGASV